MKTDKDSIYSKALRGLEMVATSSGRRVEYRSYSQLIHSTFRE